MMRYPGRAVVPRFENSLITRAGLTDYGGMAANSKVCAVLACCKAKEMSMAKKSPAGLYWQGKYSTAGKNG